MDNKFPLHVEVIVFDEGQLRAVYAVLANPALADPLLMKNFLSSASGAAVARGSTRAENEAKEIPGVKSNETIAESNLVPVDGPAGDVEIDAHGHAWDPALHASTKAKTGADLWRMKPGASRPDPKPGFPKDAATTSTGTTGAASSLSATVPAATADDDDDEFAAFAAAANKADAGDKAAAAAASVPARKWTDGDLGSLCNQAVTKLGAEKGVPAVKEIIADFVPIGEIPHSRRVPEADREAFAAAIEKAAGIKFAG